MKREDWKTEFQEFMSEGRGAIPPGALSARVKETVGRALHPSPWKVFGKLLGVQTAVGALTVWVCPQFDLPYATHDGIFGWLHHYSPVACMAACGAFFLGLSALVAAFLLSWDEIRVLRRTGWAQLPAVGAAYLLLFHFVTGDVAWATGVAWLAGGVAAAFALLGLGRRVRFGTVTGH